METENPFAGMALQPEGGDKGQDMEAPLQDCSTSEGEEEKPWQRENVPDPEVPVLAGNNRSTNDGWVKARNPALMSEQEKKKNIQKAKQKRGIGKGGGASKKKAPKKKNRYDSDSEEIEDDSFIAESDESEEYNPKKRANKRARPASRPTARRRKAAAILNGDSEEDELESGAEETSESDGKHAAGESSDDVDISKVISNGRAIARRRGTAAPRSSIAAGWEGEDSVNGDSDEHREENGGGGSASGTLHSTETNTIEKAVVSIDSDMDVVATSGVDKSPTRPAPPTQNSNVMEVFSSPEEKRRAQASSNDITEVLSDAEENITSHANGKKPGAWDPIRKRATTGETFFETLSDSDSTVAPPAAKRGADVEIVSSDDESANRARGPKKLSRKGGGAGKEKAVPKKSKGKKRKHMDYSDSGLGEFMSEDSGSDDGDDEERAQLRAAKVLSTCQGLSDQLMTAITAWGGMRHHSEGGALDLSEVHASAPAAAGLFTDADVERTCPGLKLSAYQLAGVNWLLLLRNNGLNGILADEMGLGKTVQCIAFFALIRDRAKSNPDEEPIGPHIVVVPSSVLSNWQQEFQRFAPSLKIATYHGTQGHREDLREEVRELRRAGLKRHWGDYDVVLTTYSMWEREAAVEDRKFVKDSKSYDTLVLDEGHSIKNSEGSRFKQLMMMKTQHRLLLSGTPVQNNLKELLALLTFLMPDIFHKDETTTRVLLTMLEKGVAESKEIVIESEGAPATTNNVRNMLAPFILRRLKSAVLDQLVPKTMVVEVLPLKDDQRKLYDGIIEAHARHKNLIKGARKIYGTGEQNGQPAAALTDVGSASEVKHLFTELRKAANHPLLIRHHFKDADVREVANVALATGHFGQAARHEQVLKELMGYSDYDLHQISDQYTPLQKFCLDEECLFHSVKMERLKELLPQLKAEGRRVLLFSQWTRILDLMEVFLKNVLGYTYKRLDGSTPVGERQGLINEFTADTSIPVFLLSTRAGGLGINLTAADTVILHDLDWNPENDRQAEDRCHRIGQTKPVRIIKLVAKDTVDEAIYQIGLEKGKINEAVLGDERGTGGEASNGKAIASILSRAISTFLCNYNASPPE